MFCRHCGAPVEATQAFCGGCGKSLVDDVPKSAPSFATTSSILTNKDQLSLIMLAITAIQFLLTFMSWGEMFIVETSLWGLLKIITSEKNVWGVSQGVTVSTIIFFLALFIIISLVELLIFYFNLFIPQRMTGKTISFGRAGVILNCIASIACLIYPATANQQLFGSSSGFLGVKVSVAPPVYFFTLLAVLNVYLFFKLKSLLNE